MAEMGSGYSAALSGSAFFVLPDGGFLRISGDDRAAFLQRQSSNDVRRLAPGRTVLTVLTTPMARILDVLCLLDEGQSLGALTLPGQSAATYQFLRSRIFFMDKVTVEQASAGLVQIELFGPQAAGAAAGLGVDRLPGPGEWAELQFGGARLRLIGQEREFGPGWLLLVPAEVQSPVVQALEAAGARAVSAEERQVLRVEAGLPSAGAELTEAYTPFEAGLAAAVSDAKGCYTGQEILARQVTYDKVVQQLRALKLEAMLDPGVRLLAEDGQPAGVVTSAVHSPRFGPIALAVLRRPSDQPGVHLHAGTPQGPLAIVSLPGSWI